LDENAETKTVDEIRLAATICDYRSSYESIQTVVYGLLNNIGVSKWKIRRKNHPSFIPGRVACIEVDGREVGVMGEIHPEVLTKFQMPNPVAAFEFSLTSLFTEEL